MARSTRLAALLLVLGSVMGASIAPHVAAWGKRWPHQVFGPMAAPCSSPPAGVPFLTDQLGAQARLSVEAAFGADLTAPDNTWNWYDITTDVRHDEQGGGVYISPMARSDEFSQAQPAGLRFQLLNPAGDYTKGNPVGRWYPYIRRNTPIRVSINLTGWAGDTSIRFQGYATGWTPSWDASGNRALVSVAAAGVLRRQLQGTSPQLSALYRAIAATAPVAWWPLEDGALVSAPTAVVGTPMVATPATAGSHAATGLVSGGVDGPSGGGRAADLSGGGQLIGTVTGTSGMSWRVGLAIKFNTPLVAGQAGNILTITTQDDTTGQVGWWQLATSVAPSNNWQFEFGILGVDTYFDGSSPNLDDGDWHWVELTAETGSGTNVNYTVTIDGTLRGSSTNVGPIKAGRITQLAISDSGDLDAVAHVAVWATDTALSKDLYAASTGHAGETATDRLIRLCAENGMPITITGPSDVTMGPQGTEAVPTVLRECESADGGILHDGLSAGWTYVARSSMYNQTAALTLDATVGQVALPYGPVDDDQRVRNRVKVNRKDGSTATYERTDGPLGTDTVGVYDDEVTLNVDSDDVLDAQAAWRVRKGTATDDLRQPSVTLDLRRSPELAADWLAARAGSRIDMTGLPSVAPQHPPDDVSQIIEGWAEALSPFVWLATPNASPYQPWEVGVVEGTGAPLAPAARVDTDGSSLTADVDTTATSLSVASDDIRWVDSATYPADFPLDIEIEGEQVTVSAITGTSSPQTFTVTRSVNGVVKAHAAGTAVKLWRPAGIAL